MSKTNKTKIRVGMMSLGCPKTLVDSEVILGKLDSNRYAMAETITDCDVALINTCSFIKDAQEESIDRILELVALKREKQIRTLVVLGCMVQQFPKDLQNELTEVDAFVGSGDYAQIPKIIDDVTSGQSVVSIGKPGYLGSVSDARIALTPSFYRYLKVSEGCDHICSFCTIPSFRGKHRSRTIADVVGEAKNLIKAGAKEIILTGQDTTYFGRDQGGDFLLPELLRQLDELPGLEWLRVLYAYPSCLPTSLMEAIRDGNKICHYLDMPLQHASDAMLLAMRRGITKRRTTDLIHKFRTLVPDLAIRTTFIVGFPGETQKDFQELIDFMAAMKFDRLGIFQYSHEAGSHAAGLPNQVPEEIKQERFEQAMILQQEISNENNKKWLGKSLRVLVERRDEKDKNLWVGRSYMDAPEVDGNVLIQSSEILQPGNFYPVSITETAEYDLVGTVQI